MPNHVQHDIEFTGPAEQVTALLNHIKGDKEGDLFDFNTVTPMPDALIVTSSPSEPNEELIAKYGHSDWYSWALDNWGTKWGAYETELTGSGHLRFRTAWSTAPKVFAKLSKLFPEVRMRIEYADEDIGSNVGTLEYLAGESVYELVGGVQEACTIWGYEYDSVKDEAIWD